MQTGKGILIPSILKSWKWYFEKKSDSILRQRNLEQVVIFFGKSD